MRLVPISTGIIIPTKVLSRTNTFGQEDAIQNELFSLFTCGCKGRRGYYQASAYVANEYCHQCSHQDRPKHQTRGTGKAVSRHVPMLVRYGPA